MLKKSVLFLLVFSLMAGFSMVPFSADRNGSVGVNRVSAAEGDDDCGCGAGEPCYQCINGTNCADTCSVIADPI